MLKACYRLRAKRDFNAVYETRRSAANKILVAFVLDRGDEGPTRFGFSISRKIGKAHVRNRCKRRLSEITRWHMDAILPGKDVVIIARKPIVDLDHTSLEAAYLSLLERCGIFEKSV